MAISISVLILVIGLISLLTLPVEQYPDIAPPTVYVSAQYTGADAEAVMNSVIMPLEESINGVENMMYITSTASNSGLAPCPMHTPTIPAHHEGNGFDLLFLVQVLKSFLFYTQLVYSNRLAEEKAGHLYAVCLLPDAKARRRAGLTAPARARCRPVPSARC